MNTRVLLIALLCALLATLVVFPAVHAAEEEDDYDDAAAETAEEAAEEEDYESAYEPEQINLHPLTDMPEASPDVITSYFFTKGIENGLPVGEEASVVVGLINNGEHSINITRAMGSLNSPFNFGFYVQNFTTGRDQQGGRVYQPQVEVPAGEERSVEFSFTPREDIEPVDFVLCLTVFYEDDEETFSSHFFNQTVKFYEPATEMDAQSVFTMFVGVGFALSLTYVLFTCVVGGKRSGVSVSADASGKGTAQDWIDSNHLAAGKKRGSSSPRKSMRKRN